MTFSLIPFWTKISLISFPEVITGPGEGYIKELDSTGVSGVKPNCSADHCPTIWKRFAYPATGIVKAAIRQIMVAATSRLLRRNGLLWIDFLHMALFGMTAKQWRDAHPDLKGNIRDYANVSQLVCLSNLENLNAVFISEGMTQAERLAKLNAIAISQMKVLTEDHRLLQLDAAEDTQSKHD